MNEKPPFSGWAVRRFEKLRKETARDVYNSLFNAKDKVVRLYLAWPMMFVDVSPAEHKLIPVHYMAIHYIDISAAARSDDR